MMRRRRRRRRLVASECQKKKMARVRARVCLRSDLVYWILQTPPPPSLLIADTESEARDQFTAQYVFAEAMSHSYAPSPSAFWIFAQKPKVLQPRRR